MKQILVLPIKKPLAISVVLAVAILMIVPFVRAQEGNRSQTGGNGLQISPTRNEVFAQPGEKKTFSLTIRNVTNGDLVARASVKDFESDNESGAPVFIVDENQSTPYTIKKFLEGLTDIELKAGEVKEANLTLDIPADAVPGAYFGAIVYEAEPKSKSQQQADRQVSLNASVAHLVLVEVAGEITEQIQLQSLTAQHAKYNPDGSVSSVSSGQFLISQPNRMALAIKNTGSGFSRPVGNVLIKNMLGKQVASYEINNTDPKGVILPDSSRTFIDSVESIKLPGRYTSTAAVAYKSGGEVVLLNTAFWYVPIWMLAILFVLLLLIIFGAWRIYKKRFA